MKSNMLLGTISLSGVLLLAATQIAQADATIVMDRLEVSSGKVVDSQNIQIAQNKIRLAVPQQNSWVLFDAAKKNITQVIVDKKKYVVIDETTLKKLVELQSAALTQAQAQLANLPPAQKAQMEAMMGKLLPKSQPQEELKVKATGVSKDVGGKKCKSYEILLGAKKISENCVVDRKDFGLPTADYQTLAEMFKFSKELTAKLPQGAEFSASTTAVWDQGEVIPVESQLWQEDKPGDYKMVFNSLKKDAIPAAVFTIPADYTEQKLLKNR